MGAHLDPTAAILIGLVVTLLPVYMLTNFGRFLLIFNKMALTFLGVLIVFTVSSFEFQQVRLP